MITSMTEFKWLSKDFASLSFRRSSLSIGRVNVVKDFNQMVQKITTRWHNYIAVYQFISMIMTGIDKHRVNRRVWLLHSFFYDID